MWHHHIADDGVDGEIGRGNGLASDISMGLDFGRHRHILWVCDTD
jgi:hypothetical protein